SLRVSCLGWAQGPRPQQGPDPYRCRHPGRGAELEPARCAGGALERCRLGRGGTMTERHYFSTCPSVPAPRWSPLAPKTSKPRRKWGKGKSGRPTESENPSNHTAHNRHFTIYTAQPARPVTAKRHYVRGLLGRGWPRRWDRRPWPGSGPRDGIGWTAARPPG